MFRLILHIWDVARKKAAVLPLASLSLESSCIKAPHTHTHYLQCINLQTVLQLSLPLSTAGLGLNYIWAEAVVQSKSWRGGRGRRSIREVLSRGISLCNKPGASRHCAPSDSRDQNVSFRLRGGNCCDGQRTQQQNCSIVSS